MMVELHPYQATAVANTMGEFDAGRDGALAVMATGTGKTYVGCAVAAEHVRRGGRVLIMAHRGELLRQWARSLDAFGLTWATEKANERARRDAMFGRVDVVLGSKDTLQKKRLKEWPEAAFSLIICDEAHHGIARTYLNVFQHFAKARRLGLTATPERGDSEDIQQVFGNCTFEYPLWRAIEDGFLVPPFFRRPACSVDLSKLAVAGDDLNQGDLEDEISAHVEELVNGARREIGDRPTMAFTPRVGSAQAMADGFRQVGVTANSVHGDSEDRDVVIADFRSLDYQALCSCALLLEGADFPAVAALVMARPTKSEIIYKQMLGRGLRTYPGKTSCMIVDYAWNSGRHDLFRPIDLFDASDMDLDILKLAGKLLDEGKQEDPREALVEAREIHRRELALRVAVRERDPRYRLIAFDPFQVGSLLGVPKRHVSPTAKALTAANRRRLEGFKLETKGITDAEARRLLKELEARRAKGLATHRQVASLVSNGVPADQARDMSKSTASGDLDIIIGWQRQERAS